MSIRLLTLCACVLLALSARAMDPSSLAEAQQLLQSGDDVPGAMKLLAEAAAVGDTDAMAMLGGLYFDGTRVAADRPLGIAYLQLAVAVGGPGDGNTQKLISVAQAAMTGQELIDADRQFARLNSELQAGVAEQLAPAVRAFTDAAPVAYIPEIRFAGEPVKLGRPPEERDEDRFMVGCGAEKQSGCPSASKAVVGRDCTGELFAVDADASSSPGGAAKMVMPRYPAPGQRSGLQQGFVQLLAHVGSSGWVCGVVIAVSSGDPAFDAAALKAGARSKFSPATRNGVPAEALHRFGYSFRISY